MIPLTRAEVARESTREYTRVEMTYRKASRRHAMGTSIKGPLDDGIRGAGKVEQGRGRRRRGSTWMTVTKVGGGEGVSYEDRDGQGGVGRRGRAEGEV